MKTEEEMKKRMEEYRVLCNCCNKLYANVFSLYTSQANDCAAHYITANGSKYIYGYYGSVFDDTKFLVHNWDIDETGVICDKCIQHLIDNGQAIEEQGYSSFN